MRVVEPKLALSMLPAGSELSVEHYAHFFEKSTKLRLLHNETFLGLLINLGESFKFQISDLRSSIFLKGQFNLLSLPGGFGDILCTGGHFSVVLISISPGYLQQFSTEVQKINAFLNVHENAIPATLANFNLFARSEVMEMIQQLLAHDYANVDDNYAVFFQSKMMDVLSQSLIHIRNYGSIQLRKTDLHKIKKVREYILKNLERKDISAAMLSESIDMDKRRFEKIFKIVMNQTVYSFLIDERLNKALDLLQHTDLSVSDIANMVGYNAHQLFTRAFTLKYGYPPRDARKLFLDAASIECKN